MPRELIDAMVNMKDRQALQIAGDLVNRGEDPLKILDTCKEAMETIGSRFEKGEYFLPELIMAGEMMKQISEVVKPRLQDSGEKRKLGKAVIGTVQGDIHDIGKDIVVFMLDVNGFETLDLGIDVPPKKFVTAIKNWQPAVVGLSGFLTLAFDSMKATIDEIAEAGLRDNVKIMIGGGQIDQEVLRHSGADAYGKDAMEAVALAKGWIGGQ